MKKHRKESLFLEQLKTIPNVSLACEQVGLSRNTVYRWCHEDPEFKARLDEALENGIDSVNDLAESKLITNINNGNMRAIQYWLDNHKPDYIRPRAKDFWQRFFPNDIIPPITAINILPVDPKMFADPARRGQLGVRLYEETLKRMEGERAQEDSDEPKSEDPKSDSN